MSKDIKVKAVEESAKLVQQLGHFIAKFIDGPLEQASGIVTDKLLYMRWERQQRYIRRANELMGELGLSQPTRAVPLNFAVSVLQEASMEENDELQDLWAKLLINAGDANSGVEPNRAFIGILQNMGPLEAQILFLIYQSNTDGNSEIRDITPSKLCIAMEEARAKIEGLPEERLEVALWNLERLGCITNRYMSPVLSVQTSHITPLGRALVEACTLRTERA